MMTTTSHNVVPVDNSPFHPRGTLKGQDWAHLKLCVAPPVSRALLPAPTRYFATWYLSLGAARDEVHLQDYHPNVSPAFGDISLDIRKDPWVAHAHPACQAPLAAALPLRSRRGRLVYGSS
ncbi:hypothetical protein BC826DRAFT_446537 [Russula brevipes]|nr:hypothetical protein BC826DRAFT_446537 [Russula brevipes]